MDSRLGKFRAAARASQRLKGLKGLKGLIKRPLFPVLPLIVVKWVRWASYALAFSANAQIVADPLAAGHQQPHLTRTANGLPQVDIQTPSPAGVSRNVYRQFDVGAPGAILNNSASPVQTQLGGFVPGNPWLAAGSARVILNEVNSSDPSQLRGFVEVAGKRAEVIIANPSGIVVDGGGFINATGVTLTTGRVSPAASLAPDERTTANAHIDLGLGLSYQVRDGLIVVRGAGLNTLLSDSTTLMGRGIEINASLWSQYLKIVAGINALPPGERPPIPPRPRFALDITEPGGLYAGRILIVGTEAGLGVSNAGGIHADNGELVLSSDGWLSNTGVMEARDGVRIDAAEVHNQPRGRIYGDSVRIATQLLRNTGVIATRAGGVSLDARTLHNEDGALLYSTGDLQINAQEIVNHSATIESQGAIDIRTGSLENRYDTLGYRIVLDRLAPGNGTCGEDCNTSYIERHYKLEALPGLHGPGRIVSAGAMRIHATGIVRNARSQILAGDVLDIQADRIENLGIDVPLNIEQRGWARQRKTKKEWCGSIDKLGWHEVEYWVVNPYARDIPDLQTLHRGETASGRALQPRAEPVITASGLFAANPAPDQPYLIATDARFADRQTWLGSDYMRRHLALDPNVTQKRLGDNFYESRLINEQVAQLTGRRFLGQFTSDAQQYQALMDAGIAFARQYALWLLAPIQNGPSLQLRPGIALSAQHLALLSQDIVWLEETTVTLGDGSHHTVIVPRVYLAAANVVVDASGTLRKRTPADAPIQETTPNAHISGTQVTLQGRNLVNRGGMIEGGRVALSSGEDTVNDGGHIAAREQLQISAGRDFVAHSRARESRHDAGVVRTATAAVTHGAGLSVSGPGGTLAIQAGRDVQLRGAQLDSAGTLEIAAGRDIALQTVATHSQFDATLDAENFNRQSRGAEVGSHLQAGADLALRAGRDVQIRGAEIQAGGRLALQADQHIAIEASQAYASDASGRTAEGHTIFSSGTATERRRHAQTQTVASQLDGQSTVLHSGADTRISASSVVAQKDLQIAAAGQVRIEAGYNTTQTGRYSAKSETGLTANGPSLHLGRTDQSADQRTTQTMAAASTVGSLDGRVSITAGTTYTQTGSDVLAPQGDIDISAQTVQIEEARQTQYSSLETHFAQSGVSLSVGGGVLQGAQTLQNLTQASQNTRGGRMKALAAVAAALAVQQALVAPLPSVTASIGSSQSHSMSVREADMAHGSRLMAGGNVAIRATGSDITLQGSDITSQGRVQLDAKRSVHLQAARNTASEQSSQSNRSSGVGLSGGGQSGVTVSASVGQTDGSGHDLGHTNSHIQGKTVLIQSGAHTTLRGAVVTAEHVSAKVGGDLHIESLQDSSNFSERSRNVGGSITLGPSPGGGLQVGGSAINSNYLSVVEQSGIQAADGGFQIEVEGETFLVGGVIASTETAVRGARNQFRSQGGLNSSDLQNHAQYTAEGLQVSAGIGSNVGGSAGGGLDSDSAHSTTHSGISGLAADASVRTGDAPSGIAPIFDAGTVRQEINAQVAITQEFGKQASKVVGDYAQAQLEQAIKEGDVQGIANWREGGVKRIAMHAAVGALGGGAAGAIGAVTSQTVVPWVGERLTELDLLDLPDGLKQMLTQTLTQLVGITAGTLSGGIQGGVAGHNATGNNYLQHAEAERLALLRRQQLLGQCDSVCSQDIVAISALGKARDAALAECRGVNSFECHGVRQKVRNAAAEYIRHTRTTGGVAWGAGPDYRASSGDARTQAALTLTDKAPGFVVGVGGYFWDIALDVGQLLWTGLGATFGDPEANQRLREGAAANWRYVRNPDNWAGLLGAMAPEDVDRLALAYEAGDGFEVGRVMGEQVAGALPISVNFGKGGKTGREGVSTPEPDPPHAQPHASPKTVSKPEPEPEPLLRQNDANPIDMAHTIGADFKKKSGKPTGGHSLLKEDVRILKQVLAPDINGVYGAHVEMRNAQGEWLTKTHRGGVKPQNNTMFPTHWDEAKIRSEVASAWANPNKQTIRGKWQAKSSSGVTIEGYIQPRVTAYPLHESKVTR